MDEPLIGEVIQGVWEGLKEGFRGSPEATAGQKAKNKALPKLRLRILTKQGSGSQGKVAWI